MRMRPAEDSLGDPRVPDWRNLQLPDAWPDRLRLSHPVDIVRLFRNVFARRRRVRIPPGMPGAESLPKYLLQEFHHLPNGNYSKRLTHGYITGFDVAMLGSMTTARSRVAAQLRDCGSVLDVGTAGGRMAAALRARGVPEVWALDPSPYLLQHAAARHPEVRFVQSAAEQTPFPAARFDGIAVCFVLHEIPPKYIHRCLAEFRRLLRPNGLLTICEPSESQIQAGAMTLFRRHGWRGLYFKLLAHWVHEPFVRAWHRLDLQPALADAGFTLLSNEEHFPARHVLAKAQ